MILEAETMVTWLGSLVRAPQLDDGMADGVTQQECAGLRVCEGGPKKSSLFCNSLLSQKQIYLLQDLRPNYLSLPPPQHCLSVVTLGTTFLVHEHLEDKSYPNHIPWICTMAYTAQIYVHTNDMCIIYVYIYYIYKISYLYSFKI